MFSFPTSFHPCSMGCFMEIDEERIDHTVLALLFLTTFKDKRGLRAWKSQCWDVLERC